MKFSKKLLLTQVVALATASASFAGGHVPSVSGLVSRGYPVLNPMVSNSVDGFGVNNELFLLTQRQSGAVKDGVLYVNGRLVASATYLSAKASGGSRNSLSSFQIPSVDLAVTATKGIATVFAELSNEVINLTDTLGDYTYNHVFGATLKTSSFHLLPSKILDANSSSLGVKQAYFMLGDLNKSPLYLVAGRKTVDYGSFDNLDWFWQPVTNLWSPGSQDQVAVGVYQNGLHAAWTLFNGSTMTDPTNNPGGASNNIANWALTASYGTMVKQVGAELGVSYLNGIVNDGSHANLGTADPAKVEYDSQFRNPAGVVFGKLSYNPVSLSASYHQLFKDNDASYKPRAWDVTGKVNFGLMGRSNWLALNYSESKVSTSEKLDQFIVGWNMALTNSISATLEYGHQHNKKYAPTNAQAHDRELEGDYPDITGNFVNLSLYAYF